VLAVVGARDAKVHQLDVARKRNHHVVRADVAVHDVERLVIRVACLVCEVKCPRRVGEHPQRDHERNLVVAFLCAIPDASEAVAAHVLERQEWGPLVIAEVEDLADVRVMEVADDAGLVDEHLDEVFVARELRQHPLDHDEARKPRAPGLARQVHLAHATDCQPAHGLVFPREQRRLRHHRQA
jgi:hypothetical protein